MADDLTQEDIERLRLAGAQAGAPGPAEKAVVGAVTNGPIQHIPDVGSKIGSPGPVSRAVGQALTNGPIQHIPDTLRAATEPVKHIPQTLDALRDSTIETGPIQRVVKPSHEAGNEAFSAGAGGIRDTAAAIAAGAVPFMDAGASTAVASAIVPPHMVKATEIPIVAPERQQQENESIEGQKTAQTALGEAEAKSHETKAEGVRGVADASKANAEELRQRADDARGRQEEYVERISKFSDEVAKDKIDPNRLWADKGRAAAWTLSSMFGAIAQAYLRLPTNQAVDQINKMIDRDIDAQKEEHATRRGKLSDMHSFYTMALQQTRDADEAYRLAQGYMIEDAKLKAQAMGEVSGSDIARAEAAKINAQLTTQQIQRGMAENKFVPAHMEGGIGAAAKKGDKDDTFFDPITKQYYTARSEESRKKLVDSAEGFVEMETAAEAYTAALRSVTAKDIAAAKAGITTSAMSRAQTAYQHALSIPRHTQNDGTWKKSAEEMLQQTLVPPTNFFGDPDAQLAQLKTQVRTTHLARMKVETPVPVVPVQQPVGAKPKDVPLGTNYESPPMPSSTPPAAFNAAGVTPKAKGGAFDAKGNPMTRLSAVHRFAAKAGCMVSDDRAKADKIRLDAYQAGLAEGQRAAQENHERISYDPAGAVPGRAKTGPRMIGPEADIHDRAVAEDLAVPPGYAVEKNRSADEYGARTTYDLVPNPADPTVLHTLRPATGAVRGAAERAVAEAQARQAENEFAGIPLESPAPGPTSSEDAKEDVHTLMSAHAARRVRFTEGASAPEPRGGASGEEDPMNPQARKGAISSRDAKEDLEKAAPAEMMDHIGSGISYRYKPGVPGTEPEKRHYGTTTQQLSKSSMGKSMVVPGPGGYDAIDTKEAVGPVLASLGNLNARLRRLEVSDETAKDIGDIDDEDPDPVRTRIRRGAAGAVDSLPESVRGRLASAGQRVVEAKHRAADASQSFMRERTPMIAKFHDYLATSSDEAKEEKKPLSGKQNTSRDDYLEYIRRNPERLTSSVRPERDYVSSDEAKEGMEPLSREQTASRDDYLDYIHRNPERPGGSVAPGEVRSALREGLVHDDDSRSSFTLRNAPGVFFVPGPGEEYRPPAPRRPAPEWLDRYMSEQRDLGRADAMIANDNARLAAPEGVRPRLSDVEAERLSREADASMAADRARLAGGAEGVRVEREPSLRELLAQEKVHTAYPAREFHKAWGTMDPSIYDQIRNRLVPYLPEAAPMPARNPKAGPSWNSGQPEDEDIDMLPDVDNEGAAEASRTARKGRRRG